MTEFEMLLACYRSGQVSERQWQEHLKDREFREWVEDQRRKETTMADTTGRLTRRQAAIIGAYTGFAVGPFNDIHGYVEELLDRQVWTHEFASEALYEQIREAAKDDLWSIVALEGGDDPAPQPSGPVEALVKALEPFAKHGNASCDYVEISSKHLRAARRAYLDACEVLWCETCGERPQEVRTEHAGLCHECWISEGRPE